MTVRHPTPPEAGDRLPTVDLPTPAGPAPLRAPERGSPVIFLPSVRTSEKLERWTERFLAAANDFSAWYARPLLVLADSDADTATRQDRVERVADPDGALRERLGIAREESALLVADRWGVLYHVTRTPDPDALPDTAEIEEWLRYLATQCPECGVIDEPGYGEWAP